MSSHAEPVPFTIPPPQRLHEIAATQAEKERQVREARAAELIQRNYRGYRSRRELQGYGLSASDKWAEAVKDAQYRRSTQPTSKHERLSSLSTSDSLAKNRWRQAWDIAERASSRKASGSDSNDNLTNANDDAQPTETNGESITRKRTSTRPQPRVMGIEYFLEMVDHHHRYGSNLRAYHQAWKDSDTKENFFYWLDYGEGRGVDLENRPRKRLDEEKVRYLNKEERKMYLVNFDQQGLLRWAKNGELIDTSAQYRDSLMGIVPISDTSTPTWRDTSGQSKTTVFSDNGSSTSISSVGTKDDLERAEKPTERPNDDTLVRSNANPDSPPQQTKKKNIWIYVADTSFRMYVGIKQKGAFQHSSMLSGAAAGACGQLRVKQGQLRRIEALSGHYSPPLQSYREFVHHLKDEAVDLSHVNITRSYAVLLGVEGYTGVKTKLGKGKQYVHDVLNPKEAKERQADQQDRSSSAQKETAFLEAQAAEVEKTKRRTSLTTRLKQKLHVNGG